MAELLAVIVGVAKHVRWVTVEEVTLGIVLLDHLIEPSVKNLLA